MDTKSNTSAKLATSADFKAFVNQQIAQLAPYLLETGACGLRIESHKDDVKSKRVILSYEADGQVLETSAEDDDIYNATIKAREKMQESLNHIINFAFENEGGASTGSTLH